jgi:hypothetical protein
MPKTPIHFYLTFNPYLNTENEHDFTQAHEFHNLLKSLVQQNKDATAFWGKIINKERSSELEIKQFEQIIQNNMAINSSTHLYITDFQNLWVAKVKAVTDKLPKNAQTLPFYQSKKVEIWFEIEDMTLLEYNHDKTANKLSELYIDNPQMQLVIHGLSPFTTGIKYPCFVQDLAEEQYFDLKDDGVTHLILQTNSAINSNSTQQVLRSIHNYGIPEVIYAKIPHAARLEIEAAELDMLELKQHNVGRIAFSYIKTIEIILNDLIIQHIKRKGLAQDFFVDATSSPPKLFLQDSKDYFIALKDFNKNFSINQILHFVDRASAQNHLSFKKAFSDHKQFIRFVLNDLQKVIKENYFIEIRNKVAHQSAGAIDTHDAMCIRNLVLGVGYPGLINQLYQSFYPEKFQNLLQVTGKYDDGHKEAKLKLVS